LVTLAGIVALPEWLQVLFHRYFVAAQSLLRQLSLAGKVFRRSPYAWLLPRQAKLLAAGVEPVGSTPAQFAQVMRVDMEKWGKLIKERGIRND